MLHDDLAIHQFSHFRVRTESPVAAILRPGRPNPGLSGFGVSGSPREAADHQYRRPHCGRSEGALGQSSAGREARCRRHLQPKRGPKERSSKVAKAAPTRKAKSRKRPRPNALRPKRLLPQVRTCGGSLNILTASVRHHCDLCLRVDAG